jgi:hypothetical protein
MPFSEAIKTKAMLACGHRCCICHEFCGNKMVVHHIKAQANGREDSFENAIPLCFDCHAIVMLYNPAYPKGIKFSEQELIRQRDTWYQKIRNFESPAERYQKIRNFESPAEIKAGVGDPLLKLTKIFRQKNLDQLRLVRISTGQELLAYISDACEMQYDYEDSADKSEISQIADFILKISNLIDCSDDMEPKDRINLAADFTDLITSFEKIGYWVFAAIENRRITGGVLPDDNFPVLLIRVIKSSNPGIEKI